MKQCSDTAKSKPWVSPGPRARHWAARLALIVACAGSVASSGPSAWAEAEYEGPPLRLLSPEQPKLTRTLVASVSAEEAVKDANAAVLGHMMPTLTVTWKPTHPSDKAEPTLRWRLRPREEPLDPSEVPNDVVIEYPGQKVELPGSFDCAFKALCEQHLLLTLEVLPRSAQGVLEVEWTVKGAAFLQEISREPKGFKMQITEQ